jgi:type IV pilus assembly protein PilA
VATDDAGIVTVTTQGFNDTAIDGKTITMTPFSDTALTTEMSPSTDMGKQIAGWKCEAGDVPSEYLPGSCKT